MIWFWMMVKRLFKKPVFWVILLLIPAFSLLMRWMSGLDRGWLVVAVSGEGDGKAYAEEIAEEFSSSAKTVRIIRCANAEEAVRLVENVEADAAWIFLDGTAERIAENADRTDAKVPIVRIVERVDNVFMKLSREKLFAALYGELSYADYLNFMLEKVEEFGVEGEVSEEELQAYHSLNASDGSILVLSMIGEKEDGQGSGRSVMPNTDYLLAPTRGLLTSLVMLAGLIAAILYQRDEEAGAHTWLPRRKKVWVQLSCYLSAMLPMLLLLLPSLYVGRVWTGLGHEAACALFLLVAGVVFVDVVRLIVKDEKRLSVLLPMLFLGLIFFCPVFLNMKMFRTLHYLFPPFYYLHGIFNRIYLMRGLIYIAVMTVADVLLRVVRARWGRGLSE